MSRNTRVAARRRSSLMATSVFASTMLASIGGIAVNVSTPTAQALAAITCSTYSPTYGGPGDATCIADGSSVTLTGTHQRGFGQDRLPSHGRRRRRRGDLHHERRDHRGDR